MGGERAGEQKEKKPVRGRPFSAANQPGPRPKAAEQDFGQFARSILQDPRAQRAMRERARSGNLPAHVIRMLVENAAPPPEPGEAERRAAPTTGEVADYLAASVPPFIQRLMYDHARGRLDDQGRPTAKAERRRKAKAETPEPDLRPDQPLAAARDRLEAEAREAREDRSAAVEVDLRAIPDPEPTRLLPGSREELLARGRAPRETEHDHADQAHRAECRACRAAWRRDGAPRTRQDR